MSRLRRARPVGQKLAAVPRPAPQVPVASPVVLQPLAESPEDCRNPAPPRPRAIADPLAAAEHELSREVSAAAAAAHMFGGSDERAAPAAPAPARGGEGRRRLERVTLLVLAAIAVTQSVFIAWKTDAASFITGGSGTVNVDSRPANAQVAIDGQVGETRRSR